MLNFPKYRSRDPATGTADVVGRARRSLTCYSKVARALHSRLYTDWRYGFQCNAGKVRGGDASSRVVSSGYLRGYARAHGAAVFKPSRRAPSRLRLGVFHLAREVRRAAGRSLGSSATQHENVRSGSARVLRSIDSMESSGDSRSARETRCAPLEVTSRTRVVLCQYKYCLTASVASLFLSREPSLARFPLHSLSLPSALSLSPLLSFSIFLLANETLALSRPLIARGTSGSVTSSGSARRR